MAEGLFNYTPTNNVRVSTQPVMVNQKADLGAAKAFQSISNLVKAGTSAYNKYEEAKDKTSLIEASNEANEVHKWYSQEISKTTDPYKQNEVLQQYTTALDSIEQGYELKDEYKKTFTASNLKFRGEQERVIGKRVLAQQIADTDQGLGNLAASLAGAPSKEIATVMKDASTAYTNLGLSKEQASDKIFATVVDKKIEAFNIDPLYSDLSQLEKEIESFVQSFDPKLKNKENDTNYKKLLSDLKKEQKGLAKAHLESYLSSEAIGQKDFDAEADSLAHVFSPLELSNMKEAKANKVYALKITRDARADAEQNEANEILKRNNKALLADPESTEQEIKDSIERMYNAGEYTEIEAESKFNQWKAAKESGQLSAKSAQAKEQEKAKKAFAKKTYKMELDKKSTKEGMTPKHLKSYMAIANGGDPLTAEQEKQWNDYETQYGLENSAVSLTAMIEESSNKYVGTTAEAGTVKALNNAITNMYSNEAFSATGILKIYKNHGLKGNVVTFIKQDLNNPDTAIQAVSKIKAMKVLNPVAVQNMLGKEVFYKAAALESRMTVDKEGKPVISPNDFRYVEDLLTNPTKVAIDRKPFNTKLRENPNYYQFAEEYEMGVKMEMSPEDVLDNIEAKLKQEFPAPGVRLTGYQGINLTEDDQEILNELPKNLATMTKNKFGGIAYNAADGRFYYSSARDTFAALVTTKDAKGNLIPVESLNGADGVVNVLDEKFYEYKQEQYKKWGVNRFSKEADAFGFFGGKIADFTKEAVLRGAEEIGKTAGASAESLVDTIGTGINTIKDSKVAEGISYGAAKLSDLSQRVLSINPKSEPTTFEESPTGRLWQRIKDGASGLQGAELTTISHSLTYSNEISANSTKLHHPKNSNNSGVTIGAGYDMKHRTESEIVKDLTAVGVDKATATAMSKGAGLSGTKAKTFATNNSSYSITEEQQKKLFNRIITTYETKAKKDYKSIMKDVSKAPAFGDLPDTVQTLLVDYSYNAGVSKFPKFFKALVKGDKTNAIKEYIRYSGKNKLGRRNDETLELLNKYDFKDLTK